MEKIKMDIAMTALACALSNRAAVERHEHELSRMNTLRCSADRMDIPGKGGAVKTHSSPYVRYSKNL